MTDIPLLKTDNPLEKEVTALLEQINETSGEKQSALRTKVLELYFNSAYKADISNKKTEAFQLLKLGIEHAQDFLNQGETDSSVRELILNMYHNMGIKLSETPFSDSQQAVTTYQRGLEHALGFLKQGETASSVREFILNFYYNIAISLDQLPFLDAQQALATFQHGIEQGVVFLKQGETASSVREGLLDLYIGMAETIRKAPFLDAQEELATYQQAIEHGEGFLKQGESALLIYDNLLTLYTNLTRTLKKSGGQTLQIPYFPISALLSWFLFDKINKNDNKQIVINNWRTDLQTAPSPITDFTAAFQGFLHTFLSDWHDPKKSHRHFVSTETLLAISESLYALAQGYENQALNTVYERLEQLHNSPTVRKTLALQQEKEALEKTLRNSWQQLKLTPPEDLADLTSLQSLSAWQNLRHWRTLKQLRESTQRYQQIPEHCEAVKTYYHWERGVKRCENALFDWLRDAIFKQLDFPNGLDALPDILLGILLVHSTEQPAMTPEAKTETWLQSPPWQSGESLQRALEGSGWETWAHGDKAPLYTWLDLLGQKPRLSINQQTSYFEQPDLQNGLHQLMAGEPDKLISQLQQAWEAALQRAFLLAQLLTHLENPDFEGHLLALSKSENLIFNDLNSTPSLKEVFIAFTYPERKAALFQDYDLFAFFQNALAAVDITLPNYFKALATVILGDAPEQIDQALRHWLVKQGEWEVGLPIEETLAVLKHRFNRAIAIYQPTHSDLGNTVHEWAQVLLREILASQTPPLEQIWAQLERARIALSGLNVTLPAQWEETLGRALWPSLRTTMEQIIGGYVPSENESWQSIDVWLSQINEWTSNRPPSSETCQQHVPAQQALAQPFLDPVQQRYRVLWLDQQGLSLKDLPDECALQQHWLEEKTGLIEQWTAGLEQWKAQKITASRLTHWENVMHSVAVQSWAGCFQEWAAELTQLTVIFPAPLGQLPWETLPQLEEKLVREISVAHWLKSRRANQPSDENATHFVTCDPNGIASCMVKEAAWVAKQLKTNLNSPSPTVFDVIQQLNRCQQAHFCTHGHFKRHHPLSSALTLIDKRHKKDNTLKITFPLWTSSLLSLSTEVIVLSACESNLSGQETEGLLTPIGIGPSLAAAGAKTVIGTLWPCNGVAALCFAYHLYNIMNEAPQLPWHQVVAKARHHLQNMTFKDLEQIVSDCQLDDPKDACSDMIEGIQAKAHLGDKKPFDSFSLWAGFIVLGEVNR
jgi:hypothetical protein